MLNRLNSQINELTQLLALEKGGKQDLEDSARQSAGVAGGRRKASARGCRRCSTQGAGSSDAANQQIGDLTQQA